MSGHDLTIEIDSDELVPMVRWNWKHLLTISGLILAGLFLLALPLWLNAKDGAKYEFITPLCTHLSVALLVGGVWGAVNEFLLKRDFLQILEGSSNRMVQATVAVTATLQEDNQRLQRQIADSGEMLGRQLTLAKQEEHAGLVEVRPFSHDYDFHDLILNSRRLIVVSNDAQTWTSSHAHGLRKRFANPQNSTVLVLLHPNAAVMNALANKYGPSAETLKKRIQDTLDLIRELKSPDTDVKVYGNLMFNTYAGYVGDTYAVMRPYFNSQGRRNPPLFRVADRPGSDDCLFQQIRGDCEALVGSSVELM